MSSVNTWASSLVETQHIYGKEKSEENVSPFENPVLIKTTISGSWNSPSTEVDHIRREDSENAISSMENPLNSETKGRCPKPSQIHSQNDAALNFPLIETPPNYDQEERGTNLLSADNPLNFPVPSDSRFASFDTIHSESAPANFKKTSIDYFRSWTFMEILTFISILVLIVVFLISAAQLLNLNLIADNDTYDNPPPNALYLSLLGDSLINRPCKFFNLRGRLNSLLGMSMNISNFGHDGDTIAEIAARLPQAIVGPPDALVLFWDSDCSDINEYGMTHAQVDVTRYYYQQNLTYVVNQTLLAGVKYMAVAGPGLLGEGSLTLPHAFWRKIAMLDDYRTMNRNISAIWNVTYIDVRHELIRSLPWYWGYTQWYETVDGEHLNGRGVRHVSEMFANALRGWLDSYNGTFS